MKREGGPSVLLYGVLGPSMFLSALLVVVLCCGCHRACLTTSFFVWFDVMMLFVLSRENECNTVCLWTFVWLG